MGVIACIPNSVIFRRLLSLLDKANSEVSSNVNAEEGATRLTWQLVCPPPSLCTDNGVMAAWAGIEKLSKGVSDPVQDQEPVARWPIGTPIDRYYGVVRKRG